MYLLLLGLLWQQHSVDVGEDTSLSDGDTGQQTVQFFVIADGQLQVTRVDASLLVVTGSISSQFQNFGSQVFEDGSNVDWSSGTDTLGIVSFTEKTMQTTDWELKSSAKISENL